MSTRKSTRSIYKKVSVNRAHSVLPYADTGDSTIFTIRTEDTYILYGISFKLTTSSGSFTDPKFYIGSQSDIVNASGYKVFPFDTHENIVFKDLGDDTSLYDSQFIHPITIPRGFYISLVFNESGVTSNPVVAFDLNYVVEQT